MSALQELGSKSEETRRHAAQSLASEFSAAVLEVRTKMLHGYNARIFELVNSTAPHEQLGGLQLIREIAPIDSDDSASK